MPSKTDRTESNPAPSAGQTSEPFRDMLIRTLGPEAALLSPRLVTRIARLVDQAERRASPTAGTTLPSRLLHELARMRSGDATDGSSWGDVIALDPGQRVTLGHLDRRLSGLRGVLTLLRAAEAGRTHADGVSELGDDLGIALLHAGCELVSAANESLSLLQARWSGHAPGTAAGP